MSSVFQKVAKRKAYPVEIDGETMHVSEPTFGKIDRFKSLGGEKSTWLALGLCLVSENGETLFTIEPAETDEQFADRVMTDAQDVTPSVVKALSDAIMKLINPVKQEALEKN